MSQFQILGRRPFPFKAISIRFAYTNISDTIKRVKAVFWWCHAHSGDARTAKEKLATTPRDSDIDLLYDVYSASRKHDDVRPEWGDRAVWEELHRKDPFPFRLD